MEAMVLCFPGESATPAQRELLDRASLFEARRQAELMFIGDEVFGATASEQVVIAIRFRR